MNQTIDQHIQEYRQQQEQLRRQLIALDGAIQALERLKGETDGDSQNSRKD